MSDFTLVLRGNELSLKWQADGLPSLRSINITVGYALVPHALTIIHCIADGAVEVLLVNEQMVFRSGIG